MNNKDEITNLTQQVDWVSKEIMDYYILVNTIYTKSILQKYSYVKKIFLLPESFNNIFRNEKWIQTIDVVYCADYNEKNSDLKYNSDFYSLGADLVKMIDIVIKMLPPVGNIEEKLVTIDTILNDKKYCQGVVPYVH